MHHWSLLHYMSGVYLSSYSLFSLFIPVFLCTLLSCIPKFQYFSSCPRLALPQHPPAQPASFLFVSLIKSGRTTHTQHNPHKNLPDGSFTAASVYLMPQTMLPLLCIEHTLSLGDKTSDISLTFALMDNTEERRTWQERSGVHSWENKNDGVILSWFIPAFLRLRLAALRSSVVYSLLLLFHSLYIFLYCVQHETFFSSFFFSPFLWWWLTSSCIPVRFYAVWSFL